MQIISHSDIHEFLKKCGPSLEVHEAENGLMLGLVFHELRKQQQGLDPAIHLLSVSEGDRLLTVATQNPNHNLVLSHMLENVMEPLADFLLQNQFDFPGIVGPSKEAKAFAQTWEQATGRKTSLEFKQMIYQLNKIHPIKKPLGECCQAEPDDSEIAGRWFYEFGEEALSPRERSTADEKLKSAVNRIEKGEVFLWKVHGQAVSMAATAGPTPNGIRINGVYTPPEYRGHGYARANVAAVSQKQLDQGKKFCFLYTDASNPASNKIYQQIGYTFVSNSELYRVESKDEFPIPID